MRILQWLMIFRMTIGLLPTIISTTMKQFMVILFMLFIYLFFISYYPLWCAFYVIDFTSILRWTSGGIEEMTRLRSLRCGDKQKRRKYRWGRLDAGFKRWSSRVWSPHLRGRCCVTVSRCRMSMTIYTLSSLTSFCRLFETFLCQKSVISVSKQAQHAIY